MNGPVCKVCGRGPAIDVRFRRQIGMIVVARIFTFRGPLCREHGEQIGKQYLNKTLVQGWWGIIAFLTNLATIVMDVSTLSKIRKLDPPVARSAGLSRVDGSATAPPPMEGEVAGSPPPPPPPPPSP